MVPIAADCDRLARMGKNIILVCQNMNIKRANPGGEDFLEAGPKLSHPTSEKHSVRRFFVEWADHVLRIDHQSIQVDKSHKATGSDRGVFVQPQIHYVAKTRSAEKFEDNRVVTFDDPKDDSVWQFLFGGK